VNYWLDLFTGTTWDEFRKAGANISGFRQSRHNIASKINPGDFFICYLTGVMRWVGVLEVVSPTNDTSTIWKDADFPVRFAVRPLVLLDAEQGIPMNELEGRVDFFEGVQDKGKFKGFLRGSPSLFKCQEDGRLIHDLLQKAAKQPILRPVDPKKLARKPYNLFKADRTRGKTTIPAKVTVPEPEEIEQ